MLVLWLAAACGNNPEDEGGGDGNTPECTDIFYADSDGDGHGDLKATTTACAAPTGYTTSNDDCDDTNADVRPGANEICDNLDDDCDGTIDVGAIDVPTWYADADDDGFGDDLSATTQCAMPADFVTIGGDCVDGDPDVNPEADEVCNDIDDDCDELVDGEDPTLANGSTWYADLDEDGYGDLLSTANDCEQPDGFVSDNGDCDDTKRWVHPGVTEVCDVADNDCDGLVDDDDDTLEGDETFWTDNDGDGYGDPRAPIDACELLPGYSDNDRDCDDTAAKIGMAGAYYTDSDGDGYGTGGTHPACTPAADDVLVAGDCKANDASIYPGAPEICNNKDDNCDSLTDEDDPLIIWTTFYADDDEDGYGDPTDTVADSCDAASGYVAATGDCDDVDNTINPAAIEWCDTIDNDCDGTVDGGTVVYKDWYADGDGDGFGDADDTFNDCVAPLGYVLDKTDCDDDDATVSPDGTENCEGGDDNDCDGNIDNCVVDALDPDALVQGINTNSYSASTLATGDLNGDGIADLLDGAPGYGGGRVYVSFGPLTGTTSVGDDLTLAPTSSIAFGDSLAAGDANGDGYDDVLIGAPISGNTAFLFLGPVTADEDTSTCDLALQAVGAGTEYLGYDVKIAPDIDGDFNPDILVTAPYKISNSGAVYVLDGGTTGSIVTGGTATYVYQGPAANSYLGWGVTDLGDMDGDGVVDLGMAANTVTYMVAGGDAAGSYDVSVVAAATISPTNGFNAGWGDFDNVAGLDYNADGYGDFFVGNVYASSGSLRGAVYGFYGPLSGTVSTATGANATWWGDYAGMYIDSGDVNDDKNLDLILGGNQTDYLSFGPVTGSVEVYDMVTFPYTTFGTVWEGSVLFTPDWSGDGVPEVAIGAVGTKTAAGGSNGGAAYVYYSERFY